MSGESAKQRVLSFEAQKAAAAAERMRMDQPCGFEMRVCRSAVRGLDLSKSQSTRRLKHMPTVRAAITHPRIQTS